MKILIVDDDSNLRMLIRELLVQRGWEVHEAENGQLGLERARELQPDLVLSDYEMDVMNGYELLEAVREDEALAPTPFILMTGATHRAAWRSTMDRGADDYLPKPFSMEQLVAVLETRLKRLDQTKKLAEKKLGALRRQVSLTLPHELKTPLHGILGLTELLEESLDNVSKAELRTMVRDIHACGERLQRLIANYVGYLELLFLSANRDKAETFIRGSTPNSSAFITETARRIAERNKRGEDLQLMFTVGGPAMAPENFGRIVEELVDNACKFSPSDSPIELDTSLSAREFVFRVRDHGRGLTADQIREVGAYMQFERNRYEQQGVGLGLTISRMLAELHGGKLDIESTPDAGTTVAVTLPSARPESPRKLGSASSQAGAAS